MCLTSFLKQRVVSFIHSANNDNEEILKYPSSFVRIKCRQQEILLVAVTLLNMYMHANSTGPELHEVFAEISSFYPFPWFHSVKEEDMKQSSIALQTLEIDGETPYELEKFPLLLSTAESLLLLLEEVAHPSICLYVRWWLARSAVVHHRCLLGNLSPTLCDRVRSNQSWIEEQ